MLFTIGSQIVNGDYFTGGLRDYCFLINFSVYIIRQCQSSLRFVIFKGDTQTIFAMVGVRAFWSNRINLNTTEDARCFVDVHYETLAMLDCLRYHRDGLKFDVIQGKIITARVRIRIQVLHGNTYFVCIFFSYIDERILMPKIIQIII